MPLRRRVLQQTSFSLIFTLFFCDTLVCPVGPIRRSVVEERRWTQWGRCSGPSPVSLLVSPSFSHPVRSVLVPPPHPSPDQDGPSSLRLVKVPARTPSPNSNMSNHLFFSVRRCGRERSEGTLLGCRVADSRALCSGDPRNGRCVSMVESVVVLPSQSHHFSVGPLSPPVGPEREGIKKDLGPFSRMSIKLRYLTHTGFGRDFLLFLVILPEGSRNDQMGPPWLVMSTTLILRVVLEIWSGAVLQILKSLIWTDNFFFFPEE